MSDAARPTADPGAYYDWTRTLGPERPWRHDYSQTLVTKLMLCRRTEAGEPQVHATFAEALEIIERLDRLTLGVPKIVYLVGWQFVGHDSGYPAWSEVNERLRRPEDDSALTSLRWLIRAARAHHTTVSLHLNMYDAYVTSPLWADYLANDIVLKDEAGAPIPGEEFDGDPSYQISYAQEWRTGRAQQRIDGLLAMVPELRESGTVHLDAFHSIQPTRPDATLSSPYLGLTIGDEIAAQRTIIRHWRDHGVDVTAEGAKYWLRRDPFVGLQPMAWHFDRANLLNEDWVGKPESYYGLPAGLYCGTPMHAEPEILADPVALPGLVEQFCTSVVPWYYDNRREAKPDNHLWWRGDDVFMPALWRTDTIVAYSRNGFTDRSFALPTRWADADLAISPISPLSEGDPVRRGSVEDGRLTLDLDPGHGVSIRLIP